MDFFAAASPGTERALRDELQELGFKRVRLGSGGASFIGTQEDGWRACLYSRIAQRVQMPLATFAAADADALYEGIRSIDWSPYLSPHHTLAASAFCWSSVMTHSGFVALKAKDAIVDQIRDRYGVRPSVDREDADVRVFIYLHRDQATAYLDLAGEPLFRRGYRSEAVEAPLKETLAAAMLRMAGWDRAVPLIDPMCGSGTIPIEAALWAGNVAPGIFRKQFGFERWVCHDDSARKLMAELRGDARQRAHGQTTRIAAADIAPGALEMAKSNARAARVRISFREARVQDLQPAGKPGLVICNPPYGLRLGADKQLFDDLAGAVCRQHGWRVALLTGSPDTLRAISLAPSSTSDLKNGDLDCRLAVYEVP